MTRMTWHTCIPITDYDCATLLAELRWPEGLQCECGSKSHYRLKTRPRIFQCKACRVQVSVTAGTLMHRTRVPLRTWLIAAVLMNRPEGMSAAELKRKTNVHYETAWQIVHRLRAGLCETTLRMFSPITAAKRWARLQGGAKTHYQRKASTAMGTALYVVVDQKGTPSATFHNYESYAFRRLVQRSAPQQEPPMFRREGPASSLARKLVQRLHLTHHTVGRSWLPAYLLEFCCGVVSQEWFAVSLLMGALRGPVTRFVELAGQRWWGSKAVLPVSMTFS
jgi:hypothetical protein